MFLECSWTFRMPNEAAPLFSGHIFWIKNWIKSIDRRKFFLPGFGERRPGKEGALVFLRLLPCVFSKCSAQNKGRSTVTDHLKIYCDRQKYFIDDHWKDIIQKNHHFHFTFIIKSAKISLICSIHTSNLCII